MAKERRDNMKGYKFLARIGHAKTSKRKKAEQERKVV